jgi:predicted Zn-dependent protease with MMP-like domain
MLWHPDRFMSAPPTLRERAERRTRALNAAYDVLGDPAKRAAYDLRAPTARHHHHMTHAATHADASPHRRQPAAVSDIYQGDRVGAVSDADGTGIFLGGLVAIIALVVIFAALKQDISNSGRYVLLGLGFILVGVAFWCVTQGNALTRLANQVLAGSPPVTPEDRTPDHHHAASGHSHNDSHSDRHSHADPANGDHASHADHTDHAASGARMPPDATHDPHIPSDPDDADDAAFEQLVEEAVAGIPAEFQAAMHNVVVRVKRSPSAHDIARLSVREHGLLLGLYEGVDFTRQGVTGAPLPEVITIFRRPIEHYCRHNPDRIREQIRRTVLHELAHHFGIDHEEMPDWIR